MQKDEPELDGIGRWPRNSKAANFLSSVESGTTLEILRDVSPPRRTLTPLLTQHSIHFSQVLAGVKAIYWVSSHSRYARRSPFVPIR